MYSWWIESRTIGDEWGWQEYPGSRTEDESKVRAWLKKLLEHERFVCTAQNYIPRKAKVLYRLCRRPFEIVEEYEVAPDATLSKNPVVAGCASGT
jgi:hypothetical protein